MSVGGLSKARLGRMHDVMAGYVERGEVPGIGTLVSRRGEVHVDSQPPEGPSRFLDLGLPEDRRLRRGRDTGRGR